MEKFKGTPGPWSAKEHHQDSTEVVDGNGFSHLRAEGCAILLGWDEKGFIHWGDSEEAHRYLSREEQRANAQLIAAAPELLEALQDALHANDKHGEYPEWDFARAAIKKALGEKQ